MAKGLRDILKEAGQTEEQINATLATLGPASKLFETTLQEADRQNTEAATRLAEADRKTKDLNDFWNNKATPEINEALSSAASARAAAASAIAERDSLRENARKYGFLPEETAEEKVAREAREASGGNKPVIVPGTNAVPGSPGAAPGFKEADIIDAIATSSFLQSEHFRLFGEPLPDLRELITAAGQTKRKTVDVWEAKYGVQKKREELAAAAKEKERQAIRAEVEKDVRTEYANKYGNENTAPLQPSRYPSYAKDAKTGAPDKLAWTRPDKRERLRSRIQEQVQKETVH